MISAQERSVYYPVYYLEPFKGNENALGFDLGSEQKRLKAMTSSKETGDIIASEPIQLVQSENKDNSMIIFQPIYKQKTKKTDLIGFYLNVVRTKILLDKIFFDTSNICKGVNLDIYDVASGNTKELIYSKKCKCNLNEAFNITAEKTISFAGREWYLQARATETFTSQYMTIYPYVIFGVIMILVILILFIFYQMQKSIQVVTESNEHLRRFQKLAIGREKRISELKQENLDLKAKKDVSDGR